MSICFIVAGFNKVLNGYMELVMGIDCHNELPLFFWGIKERKVFSQNGEDGVIYALLTRFGSPHHKYYVEFRTETVGPNYGE